VTVSFLRYELDGVIATEKHNNIFWSMYLRFDHDRLPLVSFCSFLSVGLHQVGARLRLGVLGQGWLVDIYWKVNLEPTKSSETAGAFAEMRASSSIEQGEENSPVKGYEETDVWKVYHEGTRAQKIAT
jgi:hypothetical protein